MFLRQSTVGREPLAIAMSGVRMGERLLQIGMDTPVVTGLLAAKPGLSGESAIVVPDDATAVSAAIEKVGNCDGILVLVDIGSAILSAEMALDLLDADIASKVKISTAPLVEGAVVAAVMASTGAELEVVAAEAEKALDPKVSQLSND